MAPSSPREPARRRFALVISTLILALYAATGSSLFGLPYFGLTLDPAGRVNYVDPNGPAAHVGIHAGDTIIEIGRVKTADVYFLSDEFYSGSLGTAPILAVTGESGTRYVRLQSDPHIPRDKQLTDAVALVTGVGFLAIGLYVALNVGGWTALVFFALCSGFSVVLMPISPPRPQWLIWIVGFVRSTIGGILLAPLIAHFFALFPRPLGLVLRHRSVLRWLYVPFVGLFLYTLLGKLGQIPTPVSPSAVASIGFLACCLFALAVFVVGFFRVRSPAERRRYRVVFVSTVLGLAPMIGGAFANTFWRNPSYLWGALAMVALLLVPLGFSYAIVRHRIFDAEFIVKRSAVFSILTAMMVVITVGVYAIFGRVLEQFTGGRSQWVMLASLLVIAGVFSPLRKVVEDFVDRTFFRDRYDERRALHELSLALPEILDLRGLLTEVVDKLSRTLRTNEAAIFLRDSDEQSFRMAYASGLTVDELNLPPVPQSLTRHVSRESLATSSDQLEEDLPFGTRADDEERLLSVFAGGVWVPMRAGLDTLAILALGPRSGSDTFGLKDLEMLKAVAGQASVGIKNAMLHAHRVEQERIQRDLELARDMQRQLLPARDPDVNGLDISGGTAACDSVGGDFYDYLELPGHRLGVAIGDVCGHGIPAAMHMASLSATLRAEAERDPSPSELLSRLNTRACHTLESGQFVSLFYATFGPGGRHIMYANAGHPSPLVVDPSGKVRQLTTGGLLLGINADAVCPTDSVDVYEGTVICLYTDGLTEARRGSIEFGEDRVVDIIRSNPTATAKQLRLTILQSLKDFEESESDDDVSLIVIRVL